MNQLLNEIKQCQICKGKLNHDPRPVVTAHPDSKIIVIGQAPGTKVHKSGIPWDDASGKRLRSWLNVTEKDFYDTTNFAIVPMGFCYPGKGKTGDLPPRPECAPQWHEQVLNSIDDVKLTLLIGVYAQKYYLENKWKNNLTMTVKNYEDCLPHYLPLPHPSPRNRHWFVKNPWFETEVLPVLKSFVMHVI